VARGGYWQDRHCRLELAHDAAEAKRRLFARQLLVIPWAYRRGWDVMRKSSSFKPLRPDVAGQFVE
jgi:hypothetical protein